jgi:3-oxoacyl-[acyl-carrier protein] reductase
MEFQGKVILITGASRGIGSACARLFSNRGGTVVVHYGSNTEAASDTLKALPGAGHLLVQADIADPDAVQRMVDTVLAGLGRIDVLVNNAGIFEEQPLPEVDYATWRESWTRVLSINLMGPAWTTFCVAQHMIRQGGGKIINISSRTAFRGKPEAPAYVASKAGLNGMSQTLAQSLAPHGVYVYVVAPGVVDTDMAAQDRNSPAWTSIEGQSPLNRVCTPDEVAHTVAFLAAPQTDYLTGGIVDLFGAAYLRT